MAQQHIPSWPTLGPGLHPHRKGAATAGAQHGDHMLGTVSCSELRRGPAPLHGQGAKHLGTGGAPRAGGGRGVGAQAQGDERGQGLRGAPVVQRQVHPLHRHVHAAQPHNGWARGACGCTKGIKRRNVE